MKRFLMTSLCLCLLLVCVLTIRPEAEAATVASGTCGANLTWTLDDTGTLTISGTGTMTNWSRYSAVPWYSKRSSIQTAVIKNGVTSIGSSAFSRCTSLTSVTIGDSVTSIGDDAFYNCTSLTSVNITDIAAWCAIGFTDSYSNPLRYAKNLYLNGELVTDLVIPDSVTGIGSYAFYSCDSLTSVTIPDSVTSIGTDAFRSCTSLTSVTIGDSVTNIGSCAFENCDSLTSVTIPDSVTSIGWAAFSSCDSLTSVTIPDSVTSIGSSAFSYCYSLTSITIPDSVTSIGSSAFSGCSSLESMTIPFVGGSRKSASDTYQRPFGYVFGTSSYTGGVATTQYYYGSSTSSTTSSTYYIPASLKSVTVTGGDILYGALYNCSSLTSVTIPESVTSIGSYAFYSCDSLTSVTIPDSVTGIGSYAFRNCTSLTGIWVDAGNTQYSSDSYGVLFNKDKSSLIQAPGVISGSYVIPDSVTSIGGDAFYDCTSLTSVTIPDSATSIGSYAFYNCTGLTSVTIGDSVTSIGGYAFYDCTSLTSITIPDSVTSIGDRAFGYCTSLTGFFVGVSNKHYSNDSYGVLFNEDKTLLIQAPGGLSGSYSIPDSVTSIGAFAFYHCTGLTSITIPNGVASIENSAFDDCTSLTSITIPNSIITIGNYAFYGCSRLTSINIPDSVTSIGRSAFYKCTSLTDVYYSGTQKRWSQISIDSGNECLTNATLHCKGVVASGTCGENLIWELNDAGTLTISGTGTMTDWTYSSSAPWYSSIKTIVIENGVTSIGDYAFYSCDRLTVVTIPDSVTSIGDDAFRSCTSLTSVTIGDSVTSIGSYAFSDCTSLTSITIPDSVTSIGDKAFFDCRSLTGILVNAGNPEFSNDERGVLFNKDKSILIEAPGALAGSYSIPNCVTSIGEEAFRNCYYLTFVTIPDSVTSIGNDAFHWCQSLTSVTIPDSVTSIGPYTFYFCSSLTSITIPDSVTGIGEAAFEYCSSLTSVIIPDSVTSIGPIAFYNCTGLTSVTIGNSVTGIGSNAFSNCDSLTSVTIPDSVTSIDYAFYNCSSLTGIWVDENNPRYCNDDRGILFNKDKTTLIQAPGALAGIYSIPDSVISIGGSAFSSCRSLTSITIPDSVTSIGSYAFSRCTSLTSVIIPDSVTSIGSYAFYSCDSLTSVTIPDSVTSIGSYAFEDCDSLTSITIPDSVTSIGYNAFSYCTSLTSVTIPDSVASIENFAFYNCTSLTSITIPDSVTSIGAYAFYNCISLTNVTYCGKPEQWLTIEIGVNNPDIITSQQPTYHNFVDGVCIFCGEVRLNYLVLSEDTTFDGYELTSDLYIDLKGYNASGTIKTNGYVVYGMDSTTDSYTCTNVGTFSCVDENGEVIIPVRQFKSDISGSVKRYMAIETEDGYSFHRFYLGITKVSLRTGNTGFGYKAVFYGDEMVLENIDSFGFNLNLVGNDTVITKSLDATNLEMGREYSLSLKNFDIATYGEVNVNAEVFLNLKDGETVTSSSVSYSMKTMLQKVCQSLTKFTETQLQALKTMCQPYADIMKNWGIDALLNAK